MSQRIGIGYDIHPFAKRRKLILGGVEIAYEKGLKGHSDADVLLHAICDACLGALGKGDIGEHFPDTDQKYKDISSLILLEKVNEMINEEGYSVVNIDSIILAQEPKMTSYKARMRFNIAYRLAVDEDAVNIKATTSEKMGFIGKQKGMAAYAVALLEKK